jgi:hypothetical protein
MAACPEERMPSGWKMWIDPKVPTELTDFAKGIRDKINKYDYGTVAETKSLPDGRTVGAFKSHHTWTNKKQPDGSTQLVTGICIPGISLLVAQPQAGETAISGEGGEIIRPHPHAVRFLAEEAESGWRRIGVPVAAAVVVGGGALLFEVALPVAAGIALVSAGAAYLFGKRV